MIVKLINRKVKCDFKGCKNSAKYSFSFNGEQPLNFCEECVKNMGDEIKKMFVPKAVEPPFKNMIKVGKKSEKIKK